ncbi:type II toxin-antitoxin system RelE/ParE family toxin [Acaryochloris marina NIES-2412]|uniref:type II toxin-antitoxin system RelE/ParE family toxin n=1 Tax=Acaryochloris marina TaxID=155978 RepID=UPI0040582401
MKIRETQLYARWFSNLKDRRAKARIDTRIRRLSLGNPGDVKPVGEGVSELRIDYGPGYRVYFIQRGATVIVLLAGGDKRTQQKDIKQALELARDL